MKNHDSRKAVTEDSLHRGVRPKSREALRVMELGAGAIFSEKAVSAPDLRIAPGADFKFKQEIKYRNVEISGLLRARLTATGVVTVKPGGLLEGEVSTEHLVVEDGGGLKAKVKIGPKSEAVLEDEDPL